MSIKRIQQAAYLRGMNFNPTRNVYGFYEIYDGERFYKADSLSGIYSIIMSKPRVR